jgi:hypothetical protein
MQEIRMQECELLDTCGFFIKYQNTLNLACKGFIKSYCKGDLMDECKRKEYRMEHGAPPEDDMLPTGHIVPKAQQI